MSWIEIKGLKEQRAKVGTDAAKMVEVAAGEKRSLTAEEDAKFNALTADYDRIGKQVEFLEKREADHKSEARVGYDVGKVGEGKKESRGAALTAYMRGNLSPEQRSQLNFVEGGKVEFRSLEIADYGQVGDKLVAGPVRTLKDFTGVLKMGATVLTPSTGNPITVIKHNDTGNTGELLAEAAQTASNADPTVGNVSLDAYTYSSKIILVSNQLVQDSAFDVASYVLSIAAERIGRLFNTHTTTGTGSSQPNGFITAGTLGKTAASTTAFTYGELLDLYYSVDPAYRGLPSFGFMSNDTIVSAARKLADSTGQPIWRPTDDTSMLGGNRVNWTSNNAMASALTTGQKIVAAGDFSRYYVQQVQGVQVLRLVERYADYNQTGFVVFQRLDADLTDATAVKYLALA